MQPNITYDCQALHRLYANADQTKNVFFPWKELGVKVVLESTGFYLKKELAQDHIDAGAEYVIMSAPAKDDTPTFVYGVNTHVHCL